MVLEQLAISRQTERKIPNTYLTPIYIDNTKAKT